MRSAVQIGIVDVAVICGTRRVCVRVVASVDISQWRALRRWCARGPALVLSPMMHVGIANRHIVCLGPDAIVLAEASLGEALWRVICCGSPRCASIY